jgi:hypothetical protein
VLCVRVSPQFNAPYSVFSMDYSTFDNCVLYNAVGVGTVKNTVRNGLQTVKGSTVLCLILSRDTVTFGRKRQHLKNEKRMMKTLSKLLL